jgi:hypothetical protein
VLLGGERLAEDEGVDPGDLAGAGGQLRHGLDVAELVGGGGHRLVAVGRAHDRERVVGGGLRRRRGLAGGMRRWRWREIQVEAGGVSDCYRRSL